MIPCIQFNNCNFDNVIYQIPKNNIDLHKDIQSVAKVTFDNWPRNVQPYIHARDEFVFNQIINSYEGKKQNNLPYSLNSFNRVLKEFHFNPHPQIYTKWLKNCRMLNHLDLAIILIEHFRSNHTFEKSQRDYLILYTILMDISKKNEKLDLCISYCREMKRLKVKPDVTCYTILINVYAKKERLDLCLFYYRKMKNLGIKLNQKCYGALIYACGKNHRPKLALAFWKEMKSKKMPSADVKTLSVVVDALSWDYPSFNQLEKKLPPSLMGRIKILQKKGEIEKKFDFHRWSSKLAQLILYLYLKNKKDTSPLILIPGIGKNNISGKMFAMKTHIITFLENYSSKEFSLTIKHIKRNLGRIDVLFTKRTAKENRSDLSSSILRLINSLSDLKRIQIDRETPVASNLPY